MREKTLATLLVVVGPLLLLGVIAAFMYFGPKYKIYTQQMRGEADYREAEINRRVLVEEARAKAESLELVASSEAKRDLMRAQAQAEAIQAVGDALQRHPDYLRLHWINEVAGSEGERIYIPTEAGMPILEAGAANRPVVAQP